VFKPLTYGSSQVFELALEGRAKASGTTFRGMSLTKSRATFFRFQARVGL
jgi:hypothetical protein